MTEQATTKKVLFLCTGNSCRSQMAEAWAKNFRSEEWQPFSAGIEQHGMNPNVMSVMSEKGIDMEQHFSKTLDELDDLHFDVVVTVCDNAATSCPTFPSKTHLVHAPFDDPPKLAANSEDPLECYRTVRDQIAEYIQTVKL